MENWRPVNVSFWQETQQTKGAIILIAKSDLIALTIHNNPKFQKTTAPNLKGALQMLL